MGKKILFSASTISHIKNFHLPYLKAFHEQGYEVWVAANRCELVPYADKVIALPFYKSFLSFQNIKAIIAARQLFKQEDFDFISTHTTLASAIIRMAILLLNKRPKVLYTSHGYLFHESDFFKKWLYLLPEKICAHITNVLMVMNHEDYDIAKKHRLYKDKLCFIDGMGIDLVNFAPISKEERSRRRKDQGFSDRDFLFVYAAEFSKRKNQNLLIRAFASVSKKIPDAKLLLAGDGALLEECRMLVKELHMDRQIYFLGYVKEMRHLYGISDVCVTTSLIEGLPFNVMEAMACGLPVIASRVKGHVELVEEGMTGLLFESGNQAELEEKIQIIYKNKDFRSKFQIEGKLRVQEFDIRKVKGKILGAY